MLTFDFNLKFSEIYNQDIPEDASDVILRFIKNSRTFYHNCNTGICSNVVKDVVRDGHCYIIINKSAKEKIGYFTEYNEKYDVLVLRMVAFPTKTVPKDGEKRYWYKNDVTENYCYIITKDGTVYAPYEDYDFKPAKLDKYIDVYASSIEKYRYGDGVYNCITTLHKKSSMIAISYLGNMFCRSGLNYSSVHPSNYSAMILATPINVLSRQEKAQGIIDIKLTEIGDKVKKRAYNVYKKYVNRRCDDNDIVTYNHSNFLWGRLDVSFAVIQKVIDGISCIRQFQICTSVDKTSETMCLRIKDESQISLFETVRIYVTNDDFYVCKNMFGKWVVCKKGLFAENFDFILLAADNKAIESSKLKYFRANIEECLRLSSEEKVPETVEYWYRSDIARDARFAAKNLYLMLSSKLFESIIKSQYTCYHDIARRHGDVSLKKIMEVYFGEFDEKQSSLLKAVGVPSYMLLKINNMYDATEKDEVKIWVKQAIAFFKKVFSSNLDYFKRLDSKSFDELLTAYRECSFLTCYTYTGVQTLKKMIDLKGIHNVAEYLRHMASIYAMERDKITHAYWHPRTTAINIYFDYINVAYRLKERLQSIPLKFKDKGEIVVAHNNVVDLYNMIEEENQRELYEDRFAKVKKNLDKFEYHGEVYSVIPPKDVVDIANEGIALHHCVKSYIDAVVMGDTIILFVRKRCELDKPFFTLEVRDKKIRQCHGFANCNTDKEEGLNVFLKEFCKEKNVKYSSGNSMLAV